MSLLRAALAASVLTLAAAGTARAANDPTDICPAIAVDEAAKAAAYYPGGAPGRNKRDFSHIAVILSASVACVETDDDRILATVSVTYAVETGTLYRGEAEVKIQAALTKGGAPITEAANAKSWPVTPGKAVSVTDTIVNIPVGEDDDVEEGAYKLTVGLVP